MALSAADSKPWPADPAAPASQSQSQAQAPTTEPPKEKKTGGRRAPPAEGSRPLDKKRARDRRAQQALRDRTRSTIHNLSEQVTTLTRVVERQSQELSDLRGRLDAALAENTVLRRRMASGEAGGSHVDIMDISTMMNGISSATCSPSAVWNTPPLNSAPTSIADQLFQGFVDVQRQAVAQSPSATTASSSTSPDITPLLDRHRRGTDQVSKVASDVVRTYTELDTLPKQIAVHFLMTHLLKWLVLLDEPSWNSVPVWLRPTRVQRTIEHPPWIDRIPWPAARDYLVEHPEITLDHFAAKYGMSLSIQWPYDPSMVVIVTPGMAPVSPENDGNDYLVNPVFAHHIANLDNWVVGDLFRSAFPEVARLIDASEWKAEGVQGPGAGAASQTASPSTTTSPSTSERPTQPQSIAMDSELDYLQI